MKIIILEDKKGFRQMFETPSFVPQHIVEVPAPTLWDPSTPPNSPQQPTVQRLLFIPVSNPTPLEGNPSIEVMLYKEQSY